MPLALRPSQRVRTLRLYEGSLYKEEKQELILKLPEKLHKKSQIISKASNQSPLRIKYRTHTHHSAINNISFITGILDKTLLNEQNYERRP